MCHELLDISEKVAILSGVKEETENLSSGSIRFKRGRRLEESPRRLMEASLGRRMERSLSEEEERFSPLSTSHHVSYQQKNNVRLSSIFGLSPPSDMYGSGEAVKVSEDKGGSHDGFISPLGYSDILSGRPSLGRGSQSYRNLDLDVNVTNKKPMTGDEVQCRICGRMLCNKYVLKVHERDVHSPRKMHQCALCGRCYSTINSLRVHMSTTHKYTSSA